MNDCRKFYIDGKWVSPATMRDVPVINPATEESIATISLGSGTDVDRAVVAARKAFASYTRRPYSTWASSCRALDVWPMLLQLTRMRCAGAPLIVKR